MNNARPQGPENMSGSLLDRLPPVRGRIGQDADLSRITWFRVGGSAEVMFRPADGDDLAAFLAGKPADVPVTVIGVGSNLLVRDGGVPGVVVRLGRGFAGISRVGAEVHAGAGALDLNVAMAARNMGLDGLEFLSGVPGTIGGALRMNAGAYEREMKDVVVGAHALDPSGTLHNLDNAAVGFAYRRSAVPEDWIFTGAVLAGEPADSDTVAQRMDEIKQARQDSQPLRSATGGSTFANPPGASAWELIEEAGCRGLTRGGAQVSELHCNFMINTASASAADIEGLGEEVRRRVKETTGVTLEWEIRRIGVPADGAIEVSPDGARESSS
jgi:UDP-N-acetylmuramate dehydrogenase